LTSSRIASSTRMPGETVNNLVTIMSFARGGFMVFLVRRNRIGSEG